MRQPRLGLCPCKQNEIRTYLKNKVRVQGKARNGKKVEHTL
jgi:hypothetical protein